MLRKHEHWGSRAPAQSCRGRSRKHPTLGIKQGCAGPVGAWACQGCTVSSPCGTLAGGTRFSLGLGLSLLCSLCCACLQKMDRNKDGVVTIEEFLESCQKVKSPATLL